MNTRLAYRIDGRDSTTVCFCVDPNTARAFGAARMGRDFNDVRCGRAPELDIYAEIGRVPGRVLLSGRGRHDCAHCHTPIDPDDAALISGIHVFCRPSCRHDHDQRVRQIHRARARAEVIFSDRFPGAQVLDVIGGPSDQRVLIRFRFPGGSRAAKVCADDFRTIRVVSRDKHALRQWLWDIGHQFSPGD